MDSATMCWLSVNSVTQEPAKPVKLLADTGDLMDLKTTQKDFKWYMIPPAWKLT